MQSSLGPVSGVSSPAHSLMPGNLICYLYLLTKTAPSKSPVLARSSVSVLKVISGNFILLTTPFFLKLSSFGLSHFVFLLYIIFISKHLSTILDFLMVADCFKLFSYLCFISLIVELFVSTLSFLLIICSYYYVFNWFNKYLLKAHYMLGSVLAVGGLGIKKADLFSVKIITNCSKWYEDKRMMWKE